LRPAGDPRTMRRRRFLSVAGRGAAALTGAVAADNLLLGYDPVTGTNLREQDVTALAAERLGPHDGRALDVGGTAVEPRPDALVVGEERLPWDADRRTVADTERRHGLPAGSLHRLVADVPALRDGTPDVEACDLASFFERASEARTRPRTVAALRGPGVRAVSPSLVERFAGVDPVDTRALTYALVDAFRAHTDYDAPRYAAGALEDNVLRRRVNLRDAFASPTGFRAMLEGDNDGVFCYHLADRAIEAFHAVPAPDQSVPVLAAYVRDSRHKHVYTGLATVVRGDGLTVLVTFLDYTPTVLADASRVARHLDDPNAFNRRHRATNIYWDHETETET